MALLRSRSTQLLLEKFLAALDQPLLADQVVTRIPVGFQEGLDVDDSFFLGCFGRWLLPVRRQVGQCWNDSARRPLLDLLLDDMQAAGDAVRHAAKDAFRLYLQVGCHHLTSSLIPNGDRRRKGATLAPSLNVGRKQEKLGAPLQSLTEPSLK